MNCPAKHLILSAGCAALMVGFGTLKAQAATPVILLSDEFERVSGSAAGGGGNFSDWGANDNGLGGGIVQTYITTPSRSDGSGGVDQTVQEADSAEFDGDLDNEGVIRFGVTMVNYDFSTDANVLFGGGYTIDFNFRRASGFLTNFFGYDPNDAATVDNGAAFGPVTSLFAADHANLYQDDGLGGGRTAVFENGTKLDPPDNVDGAFAISTEQQHATITIDAPTGFGPTDTVTASLALNGSAVPAVTHSVTGGDFLGYIGWSSNSGAALIDDLVVTAFDTAPATLTGDLDSDGFVGINDLNIVLAAWNQNVPPGNELADPNNDGFVGIEDLNIVLGNWNAGTPPAAAAVPEPATLGLISLGGLAMLRRR